MTSWRYTLTMFIAIATCGWLLRRSQKSLPMPRWQKTALGAAAFCGAMVGSKIPFVFGPVATFSLTHWMADGKTIMCGIVGGYFAVEWTKWMLDIRTKTGDSFAMPVAIAVGIGRLACFQGGCCYGQPTDLPWGIGFPTADGSVDVPRHPTQLYEAAFHFAAAAAMYQWAARGLFRGQLLKLYLIAYFIF